MDQIPITGTLHIFSDPPGANIYIDRRQILDDTGNPLKTPAIVTDIPQGLHTIRFTLADYTDDYVDTGIIGGYEYSVYGVLFPVSKPYRPS